MTNQTSLYPLRFREILRDYRFGDRWIVETYEKAELPDDHRVGETWEVCDRPGESSEVINGPLTGETLHTLIARYGPSLLGRDVVARCGTRFPLPASDQVPGRVAHVGRAGAS
jgi:mannose-6-phosphate isomerase class I